MELELYNPKTELRSSFQTLSQTTQYSLEHSQLEFQPSIWVKLPVHPSSFSFDEALLLCKHSTSEWHVWIPDFGEAVISTNQFEPLPSDRWLK